MLRTVSNPERGCGQLKEGGCYARGDMSPGGALKAWSWVLGEHIINGDNLTVTVPPRQMQIIKLPETLATRRIVLATDELTIEFPRYEDDPLANLPKLALLDHVGSSYYTPFSFFSEVLREGTSRRIPQHVAKQIAPLCPIPILFSHSWLPLMDKTIVEDVIEWSNPSRDLHTTLQYEPTFEQTGWGIYRDKGIGKDHWIIPTLEAMNRIADGKSDVHLTKIFPSIIAENTLITEQIFGISWITRAVYITTGDETPEDITRLYEDGIEPVTVL